LRAGSRAPAERREYMRRAGFREASGRRRVGPAAAPALRLGAGLLVERHDLLGELREVLDAILVRGMRREQLRRRACARELGHLLPERDGRSRVVPGPRAELEAHAVGLGLGRARIRPGAAPRYA